MDFIALKYLPVKGNVCCLKVINDKIYVGTNRNHVLIYERRYNLSSTFITQYIEIILNIFNYQDITYICNKNIVESMDEKPVDYSMNTKWIYDVIIFDNLVYKLSDDHIDIVNKNMVVKFVNFSNLALFVSNLVIFNNKVCFMDNFGNLYLVDSNGNISIDEYIKYGEKDIDGIYVTAIKILANGEYLYVSHTTNRENIIYIFKGKHLITKRVSQNAVISMVIHHGVTICGHTNGYISLWMRDILAPPIKVHSYDIIHLVSFNDQLWLGMNKLVLVLGEYHKHHYSGLPQGQLDKLTEWESAAIPIHKDINILFIRELLRE